MLFDAVYLSGSLSVKKYRFFFFLFFSIDVCVLCFFVLKIL